MKTMLLVSIMISFFGAISGCGERPQTIGYKNGDRLSWEQRMAMRAQNQDEYRLMNR